MVGELHLFFTHIIAICTVAGSWLCITLVAEKCNLYIGVLSMIATATHRLATAATQNAKSRSLREAHLGW